MYLLVYQNVLRGQYVTVSVCVCVCVCVCLLQTQQLFLSVFIGTQTHTDTNQQLLSVNKHVIFSDVHPIPSQRQDQLIEGRRVRACEHTHMRVRDDIRGEVIRFRLW